MQHELETLKRHLKQEYKKNYNKAYYQKIKQEKLEQQKPIENIINFNNCVIENVNVYNNNVSEKKQEVGTYTNGEGKNKKEAKEIMQKHIIASNIQGHIGTLTNLFIDMETAIYKAMPNCHFTAVEHKLEIYEQMRRKFKNCGLPIKCKLGKFSSILYGQNSNSFAHLIMDYCSDIAKIGKEFEYTIVNDLVGVGGIIALTTTKTNRRGSGDVWDFVTSLSNDETINKELDNRCKTEIENERYLYSVLGRKYQIIKVFPYMDKYPMILTIIKRIK